MIKINPDKTKNLTFDITIQGIDPNLLEYTLRITENDMDYGVKGKTINGEIVFEIPALNTVLTPKRINELKKIKLEVNDVNGKYYMKPFEDDILIEREPTLNVSVKEDVNKETKEEIKVNIKEETDETPVFKESEVINKKSAIRDFLKG